MTSLRAPRLPTLILSVLALVMLDGLSGAGYWAYTGDYQPLVRFFRREGALFLLGGAAAEAWLAARVVRSFEPDQVLHQAWRLITAAALCAAAGTLFSQILGAQSPLNPLLWAHAGSPPWLENVRGAGLFLGGPCQFVMMAFGLGRALRTFRDAGFRPHWTRIDQVLLGAAAAYVLWEFWDLAVALRHGKHPGWFEALNWPADPALLVLLGQALLLRDTVRRTGLGLVGRCWAAFAAGIGLTVLGDAGMWATNYGWLPWPWSAATWFVWLPAAAAFTLAPAYQIEAIRAVRSARA